MSVHCKHPAHAFLVNTVVHSCYGWDECPQISTSKSVVPSLSYLEMMHVLKNKDPNNDGTCL